MNRVNKQDETRIARYLDGEMGDAESKEFDVRLQKDAILCAALRTAQEQSRVLHDACPEPPRASVNFGTAVLDKVRRMPSRDELEQITASEENIAAVIVYGRRLLVAAVVVFGLALLFSFNLLRNDEGSALQANDDKKLMDQLDAKVKKLQAERLRQR